MSAPPAALTLGTAGHVDHGKTALVRALTGVDTDRLAEERARGISIELGYAPLDLPSGRRLSVVDAPGHERFVRTMVAGATGVDLFLLAVAADDGVMPQTREHLAILELLEVPAGVVCLTRRDLADDAAAAVVHLELDDLFRDGLHAGAPRVETSARTGAGLDALRAALDGLAADAAGRGGDGPLRLPVDRAFTLRGIGTVVTGTLWSGTARVGARVALAPGGREARVRGVHVHDRAVEAAAAGQRVALALAGVERGEVRRGAWALEPGVLAPSYRLDCDLMVVRAAPRPLRDGERVTVHHGTAEVPARAVVRGGAGAIPAGGRGRVQLRLAAPVVADRGDRLVVRLTSPPVTVAGGQVTDPVPPRTPGAQRRAAAPDAPARGPTPAPAAAAGPEADALLARIGQDPLAPPSLAPGDAPAAAALVAAGRAVRAGRDHLFTVEAWARARSEVIALAAADGSVTLAAVRDRLGCSRRHAQAILETLDGEGVTRRVGDVRVLRRRVRAGG